MTREAQDLGIPEGLVTMLARVKGLWVAVLLGSRARGEQHARSDWDLGVWGDPSLDLSMLHTSLVLLLDTEAVDLVDLGRAGALMRFEAARDGLLLFEYAPKEWHQFQLQAANFWCDAGPIIQQAHDEVLLALGPTP